MAKAWLLAAGLLARFSTLGQNRIRSLTMCYRYLCMIFTGWLILSASAPADIVWSGSQYQRTFHDLSTLDLDQDGTNDFTFSEVVIDTPVEIYWDIFIEPVNGQIVSDNSLSSPNGIPLEAGTLIAFDLNNLNIAWESAETFLFSQGIIDGIQDYGGNFPHTEGYLGVSFNAEGSTHYGWIEMSHDRTRPFPENNSLMIQGWAWETEADTPIIAGAIPEPSSGILTMVGSLVLLQLARSRRRKKTQQPIPRFRNPTTSEATEQW